MFTLENANYAKVFNVFCKYKHLSNRETGECMYDAGGYFIINGSEKAVLGQSVLQKIEYTASFSLKY